MVIQLSYSQDSLKVEPFEIGLPKSPELSVTSQVKYGNDKSKWPIWARKRVTFAEMRLDKIDHNSLMINDTVPLVLDRKAKYEIRKPNLALPTYYQALYDQGNFTFAQVDSVVEFYATQKPFTKDSFKLFVNRNGEHINLGSLQVVKDKLPLSYDWRDVLPNYATSWYTAKEQVNLTTIWVSLTSHRDLLILLYYDDKLVYASQEHSK